MKRKRLTDAVFATLQKLIFMQKKPVIFTGAGISAESGIPTFHDANGMWGKYDAMKLASVEGFEEDPQAVLDFYNARRKNLLEVQPNHAPIVVVYC